MKNWLKIILSLLFLFGLVVALIFIFAFLFNLTVLFIFVIIIVLDFLIAFLVLVSSRRSEVKKSWIIFILLVPLIGSCSYFFFGRKFRFSEKEKEYYFTVNRDEFLYSRNTKLDVTLTSFQDIVSKYCEKKMLNPLYEKNDIKIFYNGALFFNQLIDDLLAAKNYIFFNFFIIGDGEILDIIIDILAEKIKNGIKVYFIYDDVGSYFKIKQQTIERMKDIGIQVRTFLPIIRPFLNGNANYRNHRKDLVIDGVIGYIGGINLLDVYANYSKKFGYFNDTQVRIIGPAVRSIETLFFNDWRFASKGEDLRVTNPEFLLLKEYPTLNKYVKMQIVNHSSNMFKSPTLNVYLQLINNAKKSIWLSTPYFIPPIELQNALLIALAKDIEVKILVPGLTDKAFVLDVTKKNCQVLIAAGAKVYEMNNTFNHQKSAIFDDEILLIGSCNLDYRSFFSDYQTTAIIYDEEKALEAKKKWEKDFYYSILLGIWIIEYRPILYKFFISSLKLIAPLL